MANTFTKIASVTVGSGGASSIDFTSIPATYTDLCLFTSIRSSTTGSAGAGYQERLNVYFNDSTSTYTERWLQAEAGTSVNSGTNYFNDSGSNGLAGTADPSDWTSNTFNNNMLYIPNYAGSNNKSWGVDGVAENNGTNGSLMIAAGLWSTTSAITKITIKLKNSPNMVQYSTATLYGIKNS